LRHARQQVKSSKVQVPVSFYIFLAVCVASFVPAIRGYREAWTSFKEANGWERCHTGMHLFALWFVAVFSLIGTLVLGFESIASDRTEARRENEYRAVTNDLAVAMKTADRTVSSTQRQIIKQANPHGMNIGIVSMPFGEPEDFAKSLAGAFSDAGAIVWLGGQGNMFKNGSEGLRVLFDHSNPRCLATFKALDNCGWHPVDGGEWPNGMLIQVHVKGPSGAH
jgi:hypothetical protein